MTLSLTLSAITTEGNGATSTFSYPFNIPTAADAAVTFTDATGTQTAVSPTQFTISGLGLPTGGTVTYPLVGSPIATGTFLTIQRILPLVQTTAVSFDGPAFGSLESELDYQMMCQQQLAYTLARTLQLNVADINPLPQLPPAAQRANQALVFDGSGNPTVAQGLGTAIVSSALQPFLAASTTQSAIALLNYLSPLSGAQVRNLVAKINDVVSIQDFIGVGSDYGPALTAALAASDDVLFPAGSYAINSNCVVGNGNRIVLSSGASLTVANGVTLTVNGLIDAPRDRQIFFGTGSVIGMREVYPEWWGAKVNTSSVDSQPALQAAHTAIQASLNSDGGRPTIYLGTGTYYVGNTWTLSPTSNCQLRVRGEGTVFGGSRIQTLSSFLSAPVVYVQGISTADPPNSDWELSGFAIENGGGSPSIGLKIGTDADAIHRLNSTQESLIEDVLVDDNGGTRGFPIGMQFCHARLIKIRRCSVWSRVGPTGSVTDARVCINFTHNGWFTGDLTFDDVQFVGSINTGVYGLQIVNPTGPWTNLNANNQIAGIRFNGLIGYSCDIYVRITASLGGYIHDVWFNPGCQFDAGCNDGLLLQADGLLSLIGNVHIIGCYVNGATADQVNLLASNNGILQDIWVSDCWLANMTGRAVVAGVFTGSGNLYGIHISNNEINSCTNTSGAAIGIENGVQSCRCNGNIATRTQTQQMKFFVEIGSGTNNIIVTENIAAQTPITAVINDQSGAITKVIANNV